MARSEPLLPGGPALDLTHLPLDDTDWLGFVDSRSDTTPFHDPAWAQLLAECYGLSGLVLARRDERGAIASGIPLLIPARLPRRPRRLVSLPFTDSVAPLVAAEEAPAFALAADTARRGLEAARIELRAAMEGAQPLPVQAVTHTLALDADVEALLAGCSKMKRRYIRASEKGTLTLRRGESERDLTEVYFRLHLETRRRLGVPSQPKRFFRLLWKRIIEPGRGFVLTAYEGSVPVASAVFLTRNETIVYKYGASDASRLAQRPNIFLFWAAIRDASEQGFRRFDFGRSELTAEGLRDFKSGWGALEEPLVYSVIGEAVAEGASTPGMVGRVLRRSPTWVTRATGELLYRFAA